MNTKYGDFPPFYRYQYCAICNGVKTASLYCGNLYINPTDRSDYCLVEAKSCDSGSEVRNTSSGSGMRIAVPNGAGNDTVDVGFEIVIIVIDAMPGLEKISMDTLIITTPIPCSDGEVFDPINQDCHQTICPEGFSNL